MKLALLLPGYLDSPDYLHMMTFENGLHNLGYVAVRIDPCNLWKTGKIENYSITNYIKQIEDIIHSYKSEGLSEIVLIGHSVGGFVAIIAGSKIKEVTKIVSLCSPSDRVKSATKWNGEKLLHSRRELPEKTSQFRTFDIPYSFVQDGLKYSAKEEVKKINKPIMIFIAQNDRVVLPEETEEIVANAHHPYVVRQNDMGHNFRHSQSECNMVWKYIDEFLCKD